jgi:hypothetical protein
MAQVSNVQSRTLRLLGSLSDDVKKTLQALDGCVVLEIVSNDSPKTFVSAPDVSKVVEVLNTNNLLFRPHFYSLFVKFNSELKVNEVSKLNSQVLALVPSANLSYSRVDENGHTGKVVVDRFDDYNTLRASTGDITFYKFNRTKAQARVNTNATTNSATNSTQDGWKTVNNTPRTPRAPRTQRADGDNTRPPRTQRVDGDNTRPPRTQRADGDNTRSPRAPRTQRADGDNTRPPRAPRTQTSDGDRAPRTQRTDATYTNQNSKPPRQSNPNSWAGRTSSGSVVRSSSAPTSSATASSSAPAPTASS